jgi:hypothetical protein
MNVLDDKLQQAVNIKINNDATNSRFNLVFIP